MARLARDDPVLACVKFCHECVDDDWAALGAGRKTISRLRPDASVPGLRPGDPLLPIVEDVRGAFEPAGPGRTAENALDSSAADES